MIREAQIHISFIGTEPAVSYLVRPGGFVALPDAIGAYLLKGPEHGQWCVVLATGQESEQGGARAVRDISILFRDTELKEVPLYFAPRGIGQVSHIGNRTTLHSVGMLPGGILIPLRFSELDARFPYTDHDTFVPLAAAVNSDGRLTQQMYFGEESGNIPMLGIKATSGASGGMGINPNFLGLLPTRGDREIAGDLSMVRNCVCIVDNKGIPRITRDRTNMSYGRTSRVSWVPFAVENQINPWYSEWDQRRAYGAVAAPDDDEHFCRAFGPALCSFEQDGDVAHGIYLVALANSVLSAYSPARMEEIRSAPKGSLGRGFGWVSYFMARFLLALRKYLWSSISNTSGLLNFIPMMFIRQLSNWCAAAANVYKDQQLPCGAWQALTYPHPGMNPDPWEVDRVPKDAVLAQGIEHPILLLGCTMTSYAVGGLRETVEKALSLYDLHNGVVGLRGAHWIQVGTLAPNPEGVPTIVWHHFASPRPEGKYNYANWAWVVACGIMMQPRLWEAYASDDPAHYIMKSASEKGVL